MARRPTDILQIGLRLREGLRRKLENAAKKRRVSLNSEMLFRLEDSFETPDATRRTVSDLLMDIETHWGLYADRFLSLALAEELAKAVLAQDPQAADMAKLWLDRVRKYRRFEKEDVS
jgi:hypothetical protein